ncbi:hypothetical protein HX063_06080 [Myroides odoratimimus]|uniref:hypothetical protein n=1 Tax=Myroides odoratimimus TaxID=76832 RepID=UPI002574B95F|nr:hypothetical protein [Myroides odoratimimus]MDM1494981.1 hypothetical protein [Myroides odoratimimus]
MQKQITIEELRKLSKEEVLNEIRKILSFDKHVLGSIRDKNNVKELDVLKGQHYRFDMTGYDGTYEYNNDLLQKFNHLGIFNYHDTLEINFYKGCGTIVLKKKGSSDVKEIDVCGYGTVEIIYKILKLTSLSN